jgi:hypothetical protein
VGLASTLAARRDATLQHPAAFDIKMSPGILLMEELSRSIPKLRRAYLSGTERAIPPLMTDLH